MTKQKVRIQHLGASPRDHLLKTGIRPVNRHDKTIEMTVKKRNVQLVGIGGSNRE